MSDSMKLNTLQRLVVTKRITIAEYTRRRDAIVNAAIANMPPLKTLTDVHNVIVTLWPKA